MEKKTEEMQNPAKTKKRVVVQLAERIKWQLKKSDEEWEKLGEMFGDRTTKKQEREKLDRIDRMSMREQAKFMMEELERFEEKVEIVTEKRAKAKGSEIEQSEKPAEKEEVVCLDESCCCVECRHLKRMKKKRQERHACKEKPKENVRDDEKQACMANSEENRYLCVREEAEGRRDRDRQEEECKQKAAEEWNEEKEQLLKAYLQQDIEARLRTEVKWMAPMVQGGPCGDRIAEGHVKLVRMRTENAMKKLGEADVDQLIALEDQWFKLCRMGLEDERDISFAIIEKLLGMEEVKELARAMLAIARQKEATAGYLKRLPVRDRMYMQQSHKEQMMQWETEWDRLMEKLESMVAPEEKQQKRQKKKKKAKAKSGEKERRDENGKEDEREEGSKEANGDGAKRDRRANEKQQKKQEKNKKKKKAKEKSDEKKPVSMSGDRVGEKASESVQPLNEAEEDGEKEKRDEKEEEKMKEKVAEEEKEEEKEAKDEKQKKIEAEDEKEEEKKKEEGRETETEVETNRNSEDGLHQQKRGRACCGQEAPAMQQQRHIQATMQQQKEQAEDRHSVSEEVGGWSVVGAVADRRMRSVGKQRNIPLPPKHPLITQPAVPSSPSHHRAASPRGRAPAHAASVRSRPSKDSSRHVLPPPLPYPSSAPPPSAGVRGASMVSQPQSHTRTASHPPGHTQSGKTDTAAHAARQEMFAPTASARVPYPSLLACLHSSSSHLLRSSHLSHPRSIILAHAASMLSTTDSSGHVLPPPLPYPSSAPPPSVSVQAGRLIEPGEGAIRQPSAGVMWASMVSQAQSHTRTASHPPNRAHSCKTEEVAAMKAADQQHMTQRGAHAEAKAERQAGEGGPVQAAIKEQACSAGRSESSSGVEIDDIMCVVCMDARRRTVFLPCWHMVCCVSCAREVSECPMCRAGIEDRKNPFS